MEIRGRAAHDRIGRRQRVDLVQRPKHRRQDRCVVGPPVRRGPRADDREVTSDCTDGDTGGGGVGGGGVGGAGGVGGVGGG
ncbi:MAG: hypothetical protein FJ304_16310, partial [Planctomycetes bacterium]|nr:hypothetical protein [Planctomycetota bacterium]